MCPAKYMPNILSINTDFSKICKKWQNCQQSCDKLYDPFLDCVPQIEKQLLYSFDGQKQFKQQELPHVSHRPQTHCRSGGRRGCGVRRRGCWSQEGGGAVRRQSQLALVGETDSGILHVLTSSCSSQLLQELRVWSFRMSTLWQRRPAGG